MKLAAFSALNAMIRYAENHFRTEENYLEKYSYAGYPQQKTEHEAFVEHAFSMALELEQGGLSFGAIAVYLRDWYAEHILGADQGYGQFLSSSMAAEAKAGVSKLDRKFFSISGPLDPGLEHAGVTCALDSRHSRGGRKTGQ